MQFFIGLIVGSLISCLLYKHVAARRAVNLKEMHRREFQELIAKINHEGPIKYGVSVVGLMNLILWAIQNSIINLEKLYAKKDWNTKDVTTELREIVMVELRMLCDQIDNYIVAVRDHLKDYNHHQE